MEEEQQDSNKGQKVTYGKEMTKCPRCDSLDVSTMVPAFYDQFYQSMEEAQPIEEFVPFAHTCNHCDLTFEEEEANYFVWSDKEEHDAMYHWWRHTWRLREDHDYLQASDRDFVDTLNPVVTTLKLPNESFQKRIEGLIHVIKEVLRNENEYDYLVDHLIALRRDFDTEKREPTLKPLIQLDRDEIDEEFNLDQANIRSRLDTELNLFQTEQNDE